MSLHYKRQTVFSNADRALQLEVVQLQRELDRIAETTAFGQRNLLDGTFGCLFRLELIHLKQLMFRWVLSLPIKWGHKNIITTSGTNEGTVVVLLCDQWSHQWSCGFRWNCNRNGSHSDSFFNSRNHRIFSVDLSGLLNATATFGNSSTAQELQQRLICKQKIQCRSWCA